MKFAKTLSLVTAAGLIGLVGLTYKPNKDNQINHLNGPYTLVIPDSNSLPSPTPLIDKSPELVEGPIYSEGKVPKNMCARYVHHAARDIFKIVYPRADAWDIRDDPNVSEIPLKKGQETLVSLIRDGIMEPGAILGVYNPKSSYNSRAQEAGAGYTHVMLYLGQEGGTPYFADKFGTKTRPKISLEAIYKQGLEPREVLFISK